MDLQLSGRRALVVGGSRGIGKAVARVLIAEGARVVLAARDEQALAAAASELGAEGWVAVDTGDDARVQAMAAASVGLLGGIDILVNSAAQPGGQSRPPQLAEITDEIFWADVNVKVLGYLRCARQVAPHMPAGGRIVNIAGLAARGTGSTVGSIRNVAVAALTKNLADELAPAGITAVCVHPGTTVTERTQAVVAARAQAQGISEEQAMTDLAARNLLGRPITSEEVAKVVAYLASPVATAINGDAVAVGGGAAGAIHY